MQSFPWNIQQVFQDRRQYCVPFYQRAYVWDLSQQWEPLWQDIEAKARARITGGDITPHFLGAVVVERQEKVGLRGVDTFHIIDGQQRLSTLQFVLKAFVLALKEEPVPGLETMLSMCLENNNPDTMENPRVEPFKVWPTFKDQAQFIGAMTASSLADLKIRFPPHFTVAGELRKIGMLHPPALAAIWYFTSKIVSWLRSGDVPPAAAAEGLAHAILHDLKLVEISLDRTDDAQVIFETLNGRGARLNATDLIRNFIFMRADHDKADAKALYESFWVPFESAFWTEHVRRGRLTKPRLEWLIQSTLQAKTATDVDLQTIYSTYKSFVMQPDKLQGAAEQLEMLNTYAKPYKELSTAKGDTPVGRFARRIAAYDITTLHALALQIATAPIGDDEKTLMYNYLVSFVVRRAVCGLQPKNYNNVFLSAVRHLGRVGVSASALRQQLGANKGEFSRWPEDAEFVTACRTAPLYLPPIFGSGHLDTSKARIFLVELEASLRSGTRTEEPDLPNLSNLDIDHVMPRSWYEHWPLPDGTRATSTEAYDTEIAERNGIVLTHRQEMIKRRLSSIAVLGNLSLLNLSVNREAQHKSFEVKKNLLISNTNLSLNVQLLPLAHWNEATISTRGDLLAEQALRIYPGPA